MKNILKLLCLTSIAMSLFGCSTKQNVNDAQPPVENENQVTENVDSNTSLAADFANKFEELSAEATDINDLATKLVDSGLTAVTLAVDAVEEGYLSGYTVDITGFEEGVRIAPMVGSIPFVAYVFKTNDAFTLISSLSENYDLRWNICTEAEEFKIAGANGYVFAIMCSDEQRA